MQEHDWHSIAQDSDDGCIPHFYKRAVENRKQSKIEGRAVFDEVPYVKILIPGQKNAVPDRRVKEEDKTRWPQQWAKFEEGHSEHGGTPLKEWPYLTTSRVAELRALNIYTVESLVAIPDGQIGRLGPHGRDLVERAKQHLAGDEDTVKQLREELALYDTSVEELKAAYQKLRTFVEASDLDLTEVPRPPWYKPDNKAAKQK